MRKLLFLIGTCFCGFCLGAVTKNYKNFKNNGSDCWLHATVQCVSQIPSFIDGKKIQNLSNGSSLAQEIGSVITTVKESSGGPVLTPGLSGMFPDAAPGGGGTDPIAMVFSLVRELGGLEHINLKVTRTLEKTCRNCKDVIVGSVIEFADDSKLSAFRIALEFQPDGSQNHFELKTSSAGDQWDGKDLFYWIISDVERSKSTGICEKCNVVANCDNKYSFFLHNLPSVLVIHSSRPKIKFPGTLEFKPPRQFVVESITDAEIPTYKLVAMILGNEGHAVALVKDPESSFWYFFNDQESTPRNIDLATIESLGSSGQYNGYDVRILFYEVPPEEKGRIAQEKIRIHEEASRRQEAELKRRQHEEQERERQRSEAEQKHMADEDVRGGKFQALEERLVMQQKQQKVFNESLVNFFWMPLTITITGEACNEDIISRAMLVCPQILRYPAPVVNKSGTGWLVTAQILVRDLKRIQEIVITVQQALPAGAIAMVH